MKDSDLTLPPKYYLIRDTSLITDRTHEWASPAPRGQSP